MGNAKDMSVWEELQNLTDQDIDNMSEVQIADWLKKIRNYIKHGSSYNNIEPEDPKLDREKHRKSRITRIEHILP